MRKKYKNQLFNLLLNSPLGIESFSLTEQTNILTIQYKNTDFKFIIRSNEDDFELFDYRQTKYAPGFPLANFSPGWYSFEDIITYFDHWLEFTLAFYLEDEAEPDLWEEFKNRNKSFNFDKIEFNNQEYFSYDEKIQVKLSLNELKLLIQKNIGTSVAEQKIVDDRLDYLVNAVERLNKFDWKSLVISSILSISIALTLDTEKGKLLYELLKKVFSNIPLIGN